MITQNPVRDAGRARAHRRPSTCRAGAGPVAGPRRRRADPGRGRRRRCRARAHVGDSSSRSTTRAAEGQRALDRAGRRRAVHAVLDAGHAQGGDRQGAGSRRRGQDSRTAPQDSCTTPGFDRAEPQSTTPRRAGARCSTQSPAAGTRGRRRQSVMLKVAVAPPRRRPPPPSGDDPADRRRADRRRPPTTTTATPAAGRPRRRRARADACSGAGARAWTSGLRPARAVTASGVTAERQPVGEQPVPALR